MAISILLLAAAIIFVYMVVMYLVAQSVKDNSIVDIGWGLGFIVTSLVILFHFPDKTPTMLIMCSMIFLWGGRLSLYIYRRNHGKPEDFRYANWRKQWGRRQPLIAFFRVFMLQGAFMWVIATPVYIIFSVSGDFKPVSGITAIAVFLTGLVFESVADSQMNSFRKDHSNKGKIITSGLWSISRHPNYFGEALTWWGIGLFTFSASGNWVSFLSPLVITLLLRFVSGVPLLEAKYRNREDFREYAKKTSVFIPYIGKKSIGR
jgi:steroid 5-alpha reductase family enzyme